MPRSSASSPTHINESSPLLNDNQAGSSNSAAAEPSTANGSDLTICQRFICWIKKIWDRLRAFVGLRREPNVRGMGSGHGGKGANPPPRPPKGGTKGQGGPKKPGCVIM